MAEYGLVMPFVVCASQGGPYDDGAFVAGYECGTLDSELAESPNEVVKTLRAASLPQVDLIAMRRGYRLHLEQETGEWTTLRFVKEGNLS